MRHRFAPIRLRAVAMVVALAGALIPSPAQAHVQVDKTFPRTGGSACTSIGRSFVLFNGPIVGGDLTVVRKSDGQKVSRGDGDRAEGNHNKLVVHLRTSMLTSGGYRATWLIVAGDGDEQNGEFSFRLRNC